jgi:CheY-like chemotaxis protein
MTGDHQDRILHTVLVVDDAEGCVATLDLALQTLPYVVVRSARSAEDALEVLENHAVSALVTDIHLPRMDGLELISRIRRQPRWRSLPIVVVSADPDPSAPGNALGLGADAYFIKPFSPGAVRKKLEELMHAS